MGQSIPYSLLSFCLLSCSCCCCCFCKRARLFILLLRLTCCCLMCLIHIANALSAQYLFPSSDCCQGRSRERAKKGTRGLLISSLLRSATGFCSSAVSSARALLRFKNRDRGTFSCVFLYTHTPNSLVLFYTELLI